MQHFIIGRKVGMTQLFDENGNFIPVTVVQAGPCVIAQKKTIENDGYESVQIGYGEIASKNVTKPIKGHFAKNDVAVKRHLREFIPADMTSMSVGDIIKADTFVVGDKVDVSGTSKGKGYAGTVKRWNGHVMRKTHGTGPNHRHSGSNGACATPGRVVKGKKMAGHMGAERVTVQNLEIVKVDTENNLIALRGAIPGPKSGFVYIADSVKA